jgi:hypothetical protein
MEPVLEHNDEEWMEGVSIVLAMVIVKIVMVIWKDGE